jgi:hypothetical protein
MIKLLCVAIFAICFLSVTNAFQSSSRISINSIRRIINGEGSSTALFAHHPQKKIIKKKQDQRPKKHRLSDINRSNVNLNKCITKVINAPSEYTLISAEEYAKVREKALSFWDSGSLSTPWLDITADDMKVVLPTNIEPLPEGGVPKKPKLVRQLPY